MNSHTKKVLVLFAWWFFYTSVPAQWAQLNVVGPFSDEHACNNIRQQTIKQGEMFLKHSYLKVGDCISDQK